jgi:hypothetical protein
VRVPAARTVEVHPRHAEDQDVLYLRGIAKETKTLPPGEGFTDPTYLLTVLDEDGERMSVLATPEAHAAAEPLAAKRTAVEVRLERRRAHGVRGAAWRPTAVGVEAR